MKQISVFEGSELHKTLPALPADRARCAFIGVDEQKQRVLVPIGDDIFNRHILFLGGIGTGKTNTIFQLFSQLRQNMSTNDVLLIFDTKGDYYDEFYQKGDIVLSNDHRATGPDGQDYWNIFRELGYDESLEENANEITRTLFFEKMARSNQPFFPNAARDLLTAILLHYVRSGDLLNINNEMLCGLLFSSPVTELRKIIEQHDDLRAMVSYIAQDNSPQTQGVFSELQQIVRDIFIGNFRKPGNLSVREAIRRKGGKAIFVEYDLGIGNILTPIYRLLLDLAIKEALCRKKSEGNVWFIIDEFRLVPNLQHVDDGVNFGRSLGAKFIIGVQNVEQVFHSYGESLARSILSGFQTTVAFRVNDVTTREFVQGIFGKNRKRETFMSTIQSRGLTEEVREAFVVEDWDISNLPVGKAIVGLPDSQPFLFQFALYN